MPGHTNDGVTPVEARTQPTSGYVLKSSGESYTGHIINFGGKLYTTNSGAYEGHFSQELVLSNGSTPTENPPNNNQDVVTTFVVGDASEFGQGTYYYQSNGNRVPLNTPLHHHTHPAPGNTFFMTQHSMTGPETSLNVVTTPSQANRRVTRTTTTTRRATTRTTTPSTPSSGGNGGRMGGGY